MATITANIGTGDWTTGATWIGGVAPTAADNAVIGAGSTVNVVSNSLCRAVNVTGIGVIQGSGDLNIGDASGGACTFTTACTVGGTFTTVFKATSTNSGAGWGITCAGKTFPSSVSFTGTDGKWTLQDAYLAPATTHTRGELDTNNQTMTMASFNTNNSNTRILTLGSSAIAITSGTGWVATTTTGLTMTANTAVVTLSASGTLWNGGSQDWNGMSVVMSGTGVAVSSGACTVANFTRTSTAAKTDGLSLSANFTVTGTLALTSNSLTNALIIRSSVNGTARQITCNGTVTLTNRVDFRDITGAGSASWNLSGSDSGDCHGNSGITFKTAVDRYAVVAGNTSAIATWSTTSGGGGGASVPLPQDAVFFNASSATGTYTQDMPRFGKDINCNGFTRTLTLSTAFEFYGSIELGSGMTLSTITQTVTAAGRGTHTITSATKTMAFSSGRSLIIDGFGGLYSLADNFIGTFIGTGNLQITGGTLDANDKNVTISVFNMNNANATTIMGNGTWTLTDTGAVTVWNVSGGTITAEGSTIVISAASANTRVFIGGGRTFNRLESNTTGSSGMLYITGSNTFAALAVHDTTTAKTLRFAAGTTTTIPTATGWDVDGISGALITIDTQTGGSAATVSVASGVVSADYLSLKDNTATGGAIFQAGSNSTFVSGVTGWNLGDLEVLAGNTALLFGDAGALDVTSGGAAVELAGVTALAFGDAGLLGLPRSIAGITALSFGASAPIIVSLTLRGGANVTFGVSATPAGLMAQLAGITALEFGLSASMHSGRFTDLRIYTSGRRQAPIAAKESDLTLSGKEHGS